MFMFIPKNTDQHGYQNGSALVIALIVLAILGALGYASMDVAELNIFMSANDRDNKEAFFHADSGANVGQQIIMNVRDGNLTFSGSNANIWTNDSFNASDYPVKTYHTGQFITHIRAGELKTANNPGAAIQFQGYDDPSKSGNQATHTDYLIKSYREGQRNSIASVELGWRKINDGRDED